MEDSPAINHPAVDVLRAFFAEMNAYESECARHYLSIDWENVDVAELDRERVSQRERLEEIFLRYCEVGIHAERLKDLGSFPVDQPEHSDEVVIALTEKSGKVIVETKQMRFGGWVFRYELVQADGQWRVRDNRKRRFEDETKWKKDML